MDGNDRFVSARILWVRRWSPRLLSFRIEREPGFRFVPGQFARLGCVSPDEVPVWRAYSMASASWVLPFWTEMPMFTFSARSLALLRRCSAWAASCAGVVPRAAVPFMGRVRMLPLPGAGWCQSKNNSGETDSSASCPMSKNMLKPPGCACCSAANKAWRSMVWGLVPWYVWVRLSW